MLWFCGVLFWFQTTFAWAEAPSPTDETYAAVQAAFLREEFDQVLELAQPLVALAPLDSHTIRIWVWYALSLDRLQRTNEALRELDRLKASLSNSGDSDVANLWPEVLFWEGEISRKALQMVRARVAYQRLLTNFPKSSWRSQAQLGLGLVLFHQQAYEDANRQFREVWMNAPNSPIAREALLLEGLCEVRLQRFHRAETLFRQLLEQPLDPLLRAQVEFHVGEALTGLQRFEEAAQAYQHVIEADPSSRWAQWAHFGLGWSYFKLNRCQESLEAFSRYQPEGRGASAATLGKDAQEVRTELLFAQGRCLMELGDQTQALARLEELRRSFPEHPLAIDAAIGIAQLLEGQQRFTDAMSVLESAFRQPLEPLQRKQAHFRLGSVYLAQGDALKALGQFQLAKEVQDADLRQAALNGLGDAHLLLGNEEEAMRWYTAAIRISPTSEGALYATYQLGRLMLQAGRVSEAIGQFQKLVNRSDHALQADGRLALVFAYLSNSQHDLARTELERVLAQESTNPRAAARARYYLALLALHEGNVSQARRFCEDVIRRVPDSDEALESRLLLADLVASQVSPQEAHDALSRVFGSLQGLGRHHRGKLAKKLGDLAHQAGDYAKAIHWYELTWQELPTHRSELEYRIASCYEEVGDLALAMHRYRRITQAPWQIRGQLAAAKLMEREEQWQEAMMIYEFVTHQPVPEAKIAQERLATLSSEHMVGAR